MTLARTEDSEIAQIRFSDEDRAALDLLTAKQRAFVLEYPKDFNATRAAERAGYAGPENNWSRRGWQLLRHPECNVLIRKLTAASFDELGITSEWVAVKMVQLLERVTSEDVLWSPQVAKGLLDSLAKLRGDLIDKVDVTSRQLVVHVNGIEVEALK